MGTGIWRNEPHLGVNTLASVYARLENQKLVGFEERSHTQLGGIHLRVH